MGNIFAIQVLKHPRQTAFIGVALLLLGKVWTTAESETDVTTGT